MSTELELVVRREHAIFTPSYHVTVAQTGPLHVIESFDVQHRDGLSAAAAAAMDKLRSKGYRLTEAFTEHGSALGGEWASAHVTREERELPLVVLAGDLVQDARMVSKALHVIETRSGAEEVVRLVAGVMANALAIKAKADAVLSSDKAVETAAILDDVVTEVER